MTAPVRSILDPLLDHLEPSTTDAIRQVLDLFPDAYRAGWTDALAAVAARLTADEEAGVPLTLQRLMAALNGVLAPAPAPDVWAGR